MRVTTTAEQREAWKQLHTALFNYIISFGSIEISCGDKVISLDGDTYFTECGKIYQKDS